MKKGKKAKETVVAATPAPEPVETTPEPTVPETVEETASETPVTRPYAVMIDGQRVSYLRTGIIDRKDGKVDAALFVTQTGTKVDLIQMDVKTVTSRALVEVPGADIIASARILLKPISPSVTVSERARKQLETIINDKEFAMSETKKKAAKKSAKKAATKNGAASKKSASKTGAGRRSTFNPDAIVTLKKGPKEDSIKRHVDFLGALKEDLKGKGTVKALLAAFGKRVKTKQPVEKIWGMHRKALVDGGFLSVSE